ncbi:M23 family metallopeptidase [Lysobacter sp. M2-1]|uniref:M23 family metallopeptidase n=1 Tax=Lysobacter sp. M2-1 TaxID=2916839 RepID=UPI0031F2F934
MRKLHQALQNFGHRFTRLGQHVYGSAFCNPAVASVLLVAVGIAAGAGLRDTVGFAEHARLAARAAQQAGQIDAAQREVNALAARLGELQAQANRLNALGERLTQAGQLGDGEFDFDKPVAIGGDGPVRDMAPGELRAGMAALQTQFSASGRQLSVLESLLFNRKLEADATPSRAPVAHSYITSGFGGRADPFGGGSQYHKGIDFDANTGDAVVAVADGVVSYSGRRSGYGNVVEVDHGNGYVTRYAHNSRLLVQVGQLVRVGQELAKAGSTGRSTGAHVHFEVWENGRVVNPRKFLGQQGFKRA